MVGVCCYCVLDLGRVVEEGLVQGFELVLAVVRLEVSRTEMSLSETLRVDTLD